MSLHDEAATLALLAEELGALEQPMELTLRPESVIRFVALLQLALRHPDIPAPMRLFAEQFISNARVFYAHCPTVLQVITAGGLQPKPPLTQSPLTAAEQIAADEPPLTKPAADETRH
jgi:hypothetical protein